MTGRRRIIILAAAAVVILAMAGLWAALRGDGDDAAAPPPVPPSSASSALPTSTTKSTTTMPAPTATTATTAPPAPATTSPPPEVTVTVPGTPRPVPLAPPDSGELVPLRPLRSCGGAAEPTTGTIPGPSPLGDRRWVTVGQLSGRCDAESPRFRLLGIDTRLVLRSDSDDIAVFLVDAAEGLEGTAGYAALTCSGPCAENQVLVDPAGEYYLRVQGSEGAWTVMVQEYRRP